MSERKHPSERAEDPRTERERSVERHVQKAAERIDALRERGFFWEGEHAAVHAPSADAPERCVAECDFDSSPAHTDKRKEGFPAPDMIEHELREAGYDLDICPDPMASTAELFRMVYFILEKKEA